MLRSIGKQCLQCFDTVGWAAGRASGLYKTEWWCAGVVICLERVADLHMAQLMPLPLTVSCFSKIQIGFTFLVPACPGSSRKRAVKWVCVCVCIGKQFGNPWSQLWRSKGRLQWERFADKEGLINALTSRSACRRSNNRKSLPSFNVTLHFSYVYFQL